MTNWLLVSSAANFEKSRELGFTAAAMKSRHRRKWERVEPGDRILFYVTGVKAFGGVCRVTGAPFESHELVWTSEGKPAEDYPWRFPDRAGGDVARRPVRPGRAAGARDGVAPSAGPRTTGRSPSRATSTSCPTRTPT